MARPLRIGFSGAIYQVTSRGNAREDICLDDTDRAMFLGVLAEVISRFDWRCHAYCLMGNHYHVLIETPEPNLSKGMRQLNRYTRSASIAATVGLGMCFRGATRRSWWSATVI
jgi:putative transposase